MTFPVIPHAFRVQFRNADKGYQQDERIVYDDGYDETNATISKRSNCKAAPVQTSRSKRHGATSRRSGCARKPIPL